MECKHLEIMVYRCNIRLSLDRPSKNYEGVLHLLVRLIYVMTLVIIGLCLYVTMDTMDAIYEHYVH